MQLQNTKVEDIVGNRAIEALIADGMGRAAFVEAATLLFKSPAYAACTTESIIGCMLKAAIFGFRLSPELGEAWAIPRKVKTGRKLENGKDEYEVVCQFQIGYKGWQRLASETGRVSFWDYATVWSQDKFEYALGSNQYLNHTPTLDSSNKGRRLAFWAKAKLSDGNEVFHIVTVDDVEVYRRFSETQYDWSQQGGRNFSAAPKGIWATNYDAMALRLPIKEIATKKIPRTERISQAIEADDSVTRVDADGNAVTQGARDVQKNSEDAVFLHEDYLEEIKQCKTKNEVRALWTKQSSGMDEGTKAMYTKACSDHAATLSE